MTTARKGDWQKMELLMSRTVCHVSVIFNEPLTFLQRVAEYMEYVYLLHTAASLDDPLHRMQVNIYTLTLSLPRVLS